MQRRRSKTQLSVEALEGRFMAGSVYQPTGQEQLFLELLDAARADPAAYGQSIGLDLSYVLASQPLAFNLQLMQAARLHSQDMNARSYFDHCTRIDPRPSDSSICNPNNTLKNPGDRIDDTGYNWKAYGESIAAGSNFPAPADALRALIIDDGIPDLGHRNHLLAIDSISATLPEVGIGIVQNGSGSLTNYYTIDSARDYYTTDPHNPFLTGVIYNDADQNNFYSPGEGYAGVTVHAVSADGSVDVSVTDFDSGGYSLPLTAGTYTVTVSGGSFPGSESTAVTIGACNRKLDFLPSGPALHADACANSPADDLGVWSGTWQLDTNLNSTWDTVAGGDTAYNFGSTRTDVPAAIDWNGDGRDELAVVRRGRTVMIDSNHNHHWDGSSVDTAIPLGTTGNQLIVGDWIGDGRDKIGVLNTKTGMFQLDTNNNHVLNTADPKFQFMPYQAGDVAVAGDWTGSGKFNIGIFRGGNTFFLDTNGNGAWDGPSVDQQVVLPVSGTKPAVADYSGDGRTDLAVFSPSTGTFQIDTNNDGVLDTTHVFAPGRYPVPGNWA